MSRTVTYRELVEIAEKYRQRDETLAYMLQIMEEMTSYVTRKDQSFLGAVQTFKNATEGIAGFYLTGQPVFAEVATEMEKRQYALWEFACLLAVYLNNHHGEDVSI